MPCCLIAGNNSSNSIVSYELNFFRLMDLPHLMDNLTVDHRHLGNAARYPQLHSPNSNEGIYIPDRNERKERIYLGRCGEFALFLGPLRRFLFFRCHGRFLFVFLLIFEFFGHGMRS